MHVRKAQHTDGVLSASRVAPTPHRGVAGFNRIQWQLSIGMGGNLQLESVAGFNRNQWQLSRGIRIFRTHQDWTRAFLAAPTVLGVIDTYGIELIHPMREGRSPQQIGRKGLSNHRWMV